MTVLMKLFSGLCHPLLMATYLSIVLLIGAPELFAFPARTAQILVLAVFLTTCAIPAFSIYTLKLFSRISNLELTNKEERPLPFSFIFIWYGISSYLFVFRLGLGKPFSTIMIAVTILIGLLFVITKWFKISIHSTAIWSAVGIIAALMITKAVSIPAILFGTILLAGITSMSRLFLGYHEPREVWYGTFLGFSFSFFAVFFFG